MDLTTPAAVTNGSSPGRLYAPKLTLSAGHLFPAQINPKDVIHHSDQGTQYTSIAFGKACEDAGIRPSMGSVGDCYDFTMCESFNATLECELLVKHRFQDRREAEIAIFRFIEGWYNPRRRHTAIGNISPMQFEQAYWNRMSQPA